MFVIGYFKYGHGSRYLSKYSADVWAFDYGRRNALTFDSRETARSIVNKLKTQIYLRADDELFIDTDI